MNKLVSYVAMSLICDDKQVEVTVTGHNYAAVIGINTDFNRQS